MRTMPLQFFHPRRGPKTYILARKGNREVRRADAYFRQTEDEFGQARVRGCAHCYLFDVVTGQRVVIFEGACRPTRINESAREIASWLGITEEEARQIRRDVTIDFNG